MADSYYTVIKGKKYDRRMLELAEGLTSGRGDGRISIADAKNLLRVVKDSNNYSTTEKLTMEYIRKHYKFTKEGDEFFRNEIDLTGSFFINLLKGKLLPIIRRFGDTLPFFEQLCVQVLV